MFVLSVEKENTSTFWDGRGKRWTDFTEMRMIWKSTGKLRGKLNLPWTHSKSCFGSPRLTMIQLWKGPNYLPLNLLQTKFLEAAFHLPWNLCLGLFFTRNSTASKDGQLWDSEWLCHMIHHLNVRKAVSLWTVYLVDNLIGPFTL